jgi:hypothetical protein
VLEQLELLGGEVVPVLREEFAKGRPPDVPDAPTHAALRERGDADDVPEPQEAVRD